MIRLRLNHGFTLLEVMIAMIILALGILGLALLITMSTYGNTFSNDNTTANALAQQEIESLVEMPSYGSMPFVSITDSVSGMYDIYRTVEDNSTNASIPPGLVKIDVVVQWIDRQAQFRTVNLSTYKPVI
ncbi:MAG: prepilin-type N-terminal cleavage/methylation domain-containing protein [Candidatus Zixiibacteriota bacterium]